MIAVLLGMAGLSVDIANWYLQGNREQKAADAAALAGAVYLPDDPARATSTAAPPSPMSWSRFPRHGQGYPPSAT